MSDTYLWEERYRPHKLDDVIIPEDVKAAFRKYIADGQFPNLMLTSASPGTGKTTTAHVLCEEIGIRPLFINASLDNSIDDIRTKIPQYAMSVSLLNTGTKCVILDEADRLSEAAQDALKGLIELVHKNCRFIMTANSKARLIDPIDSRLTNIEYVFTAADQKKVQAQMFKRCCEILEENNIPYKREVLAKIVGKFSPDNRKILNSLQAYAARYGAIDEGILGHLLSADLTALVEAMQAKNYGQVKTWLFENYDRLQDDFYQKLFKALTPLIQKQSEPEMVLILAEEQKHHKIVPDKWLHYCGLVTQLMMTVKFQ